MTKRFLGAVACIICGASLAVGCSGETTAYGLTKQEYSKIYGKVSSVIFDGETQPNTAAYIEVADKSTVRSTGAFVYFLREIYKNDDFILSENPVTFTCSYENREQSCTVTMLSVCDIENGVITGEMYTQETYMGQTMPDGYINVTVYYNFNDDTLDGFTLSMCEWETNDYIEYDVYRNGVLYSLSGEDDEERAAAINEITANRAAYAEKINNSLKLNADFTDEYTRSMALIIS